MSKCTAKVSTTVELAHQKYAAYVGMDVHKDTIAVSVAYAGRAAPVYRGEIANTPKALDTLIGRLSANGELLSFWYEAGPCGYGIYRQIVARGHECIVAAPSLIPRKPGDRRKNDRRDSLKLAQSHRSGDLTAVWVPGEEQEAMRDLTRAREDLKGLERAARQKLSAFVLRHGQHYRGNRTRWTQSHFQWLESLQFTHPWQQGGAARIHRRGEVGAAASSADDRSAGPSFTPMVAGPGG